MNAFNTALKTGLKLADGVFLGGAVDKAQDRNAFANLMEQGDLQGANAFAVRNNRPRQMAVANAALERQQQQALIEQQAEQQQAQLFSSLALGLASIQDQNARAQAFELMKPGLNGQFGLTDEDFAQVPIGDPNALTAFGRALIAPKDQARNQIDRRGHDIDAAELAETSRSNRADEGLRGREIDLQEKRAAEAARGKQSNVLSPQAFQGRRQRAELIDSTFADALESVSGFTAGLLGPTRNIPGTPAKKLDGFLDTIRANVGFEELQRMRDNSPTGGALGQVTERELALLQSTLASFDQGLSPPQLKANLEKARAQMQQSFGLIEQAYMADVQRGLINPDDPAFQAAAGISNAGATEGPVQIRSTEDYNALQPGTRFIDPNGVERIKGGQ